MVSTDDLIWAGGGAAVGGSLGYLARGKLGGIAGAILGGLGGFAVKNYLLPLFGGGVGDFISGKPSPAPSWVENPTAYTKGEQATGNLADPPVLQQSYSSSFAEGQSVGNIINAAASSGIPVVSQIGQFDQWLGKQIAGSLGL